MKIDKNTTQDDEILALASMAGDMEIEIDEQQPGIEFELFWEYEN